TLAALLAASIVFGVSFLAGTLLGQPGDIEVRQDTHLKGDIVLRRSQSLIVEDATLLVDGNITLFDSSSILLANATLVLEERTYEIPQMGRFSTRYSIGLNDDSRLEAYSSQLLNATSEHWRLILRDNSSMVVDGLFTNEIIWFLDRASVQIENSDMPYLSVWPGSEVSLTIANSFVDGLAFSGAGEFQLIDSRQRVDPTGSPLAFSDFSGVARVENSSWGGPVEIWGGNEGGEIWGNITFEETAVLRVKQAFSTEPDAKPLGPPEGHLVRYYPIIITADGLPLSGVNVVIYDSNGTLISSGVSGDTGLVILAVLFDTDSWRAEFGLSAVVGENAVEHRVSLMTSTPISLALPTA
ncbi:MAG: hypothetical protein GTO54_06270, partial [Nitrososphaeria archaeon]|nr:hypothetical protein [Nitrososphaeria archaeon]